MIERVLNYGDDYQIYDVQKSNSKIIINMKSKLKKCKCPKCNMVSDEIHSTYTRTIQDTPIQNSETWLKITVSEFQCDNQDCIVSTFNEVLPFVRKNKVMTDSLVQFILAISIFMSSTSTSLILSFLGVKASADTIDRIIHKIEIVDNPNVEAIGIDDVATRKGQNYATAIYDLNDHHLLALLDGRDAEVVKEWLNNHKKIKVVARDRASAYASAINEILPNCIQVADRFHLFQNLIENLKEIFHKDIPEKIFIKNNQIIEEKDIQKIIIKPPIDEAKLKELNYDNSIPRDKNNNVILFNQKLLNENSNISKKWQQKRTDKMNKIKEMRKRFKEVQCYKIVMDEFNVCRNALKKYIKMTETEVEQLVFTNEHKCERVLDNYINMIYKMLIDKIPLEYIIEYVLKNGYKGTRGTLKGYMLALIKNNNLSYYNCSTLLFEKYEYPDDILIITRFELLKYLLTIEEKKKNINIDENISIIKNEYPIVDVIHSIFSDFHNVIFGRNPDELDNFIEKYSSIITSFCNGIKKDIAPVKNAISNEINSGFVEGNNNKFKLIKRIVYGKQKLVNLFKKCYLCFLVTLDNFSITEIVNQVLEN